MTAPGETAPLCPLVRDALDRRVRPIGEALVDGERAWAYSAEGGGGEAIARVRRAPGTGLEGPRGCNGKDETEHPDRGTAAAVWRVYLGRMLLSGRAVTERRDGEAEASWRARHDVARRVRVPSMRGSGEARHRPLAVLGGAKLLEHLGRAWNASAWGAP